MKIVRLGMSEGGILLLTFAYQHINLHPFYKKKVKHMLHQLVNWLYTTSGYYDKTVSGSNFNFGADAYNENFNKLLTHFEIAVKGCHETQFFFHEGFVRSLFEEIKEQFVSYYNINNLLLLNGTKAVTRLPCYYDLMAHRKIVVVSSFAELCISQYECGNVFKLGTGFPKITSLEGVTTPYCFFNKGPDQNYFETLEKILDDIKTKDFDLAVLGCGVYGHMLTHRIHSELKKDAVYVGGGVSNLFGIMSAREKTSGMGKDIPLNEYWILDIPEKYKPVNYKEIEGGCYW